MKANANLKEGSLQFDFNKAFPPFIIYLGTIIILLSFSKDLARVGFNLYWLLIRVGYLPFILLTWKIAKIKFQDSVYEMPLWVAALYITCFCTYFSFSTGGLKSDYIFGLLQLYFAIALMPITARTFYMTTFISLAIYIGENIYKFGLSNLPNKATSSTLIPLIVFSIVVYIINSKIRTSKYEFQNELYITIQQRDAVIREQSAELSAIETKAALGTLAAQVAHDIRSPLAALNILTSQDLPIPIQSKILVGNVINRIRDIANDLVEKNRDPRKAVSSTGDRSVQLLAATIFQIITEKRLQLRLDSQVNIDFELTSENYGLFANLHLAEFKRMLSNLIDNSIEATNRKGTILIKLLHGDAHIRLIISDNGKGVPQDILEQLGNYGISYDKKNGSGLGIYHAKNTMIKLGGGLNISSELDKGTDITLTIPKAPLPIWFLPKLEIAPMLTLVIVDDDSSIHQLWKERFNHLLFDVNILNFTSPERFLEWQKLNIDKPNPLLYFFDLEYLGYYQTGFKLIEDYQLQVNSVLITSHFEEKEVRERCERLGIKMIPKDLSVFIPIELIYP